MTLLPPNSTPVERSIEASVARISDVPVPLRQLVNPDTCPPGQLPFLAWALSIDTWDSDWPDTIKRARVRSAISIQRRKGTAASLREVVASFGGAVAVREWWQLTPPGPAHTFSLVVSLDGIVRPEASAAYADAVISEVARTKPARSHFTFSQALSTAGALGFVAAARPAVHARLMLAA
ncbi:phage tail protein I [Sphingomonas sp. 8AM]|uniref:phage tail protein I n=1 Tax=Sphingomonas sp. 8AM TaxID=2653170 RepID=UPI0012EFD45A|nr:phage tail protein I [Sphingomonas sp. 8AM]VXC79810.1 Phage tail protein I [Sphingomonas sp. 8AM]